MPEHAFATETVVLIPTDWDDYSFRTEFVVHFAAPKERPALVGTAKILAREYRNVGPDGKYRTANEMPHDGGPLADTDYCSLGEDGWYYEKLGKLANGAGLRVVRALNDVCFNKEPDPWWRNAPAFESSLLRFSSANLARRAAVDMFEGRRFEGEERNLIRFNRSQGMLGGGPPVFEAEFDGTLEVPGRMHAVVGRNGVGKTSLLAGIANWFVRDIPNDKWNYRPAFSRVLILTHNPFDDIFRTRRDASERNVRFLGARPPSRRLLEFLAEIDAKNGTLGEDAWKVLLLQEFQSPAVFQEKVGTVTRPETIAASLARLSSDSAWVEFIEQAMGDERLAKKLREDTSDAYSEMSAGQRALVALWADLFAVPGQPTPEVWPR